MAMQTRPIFPLLDPTVVTDGVVSIGDLVQVDEQADWIGRVAYFTVDGWIGIRQGRRLDEVQAWRVTLVERKGHASPAPLAGAGL